MNERLEHLIESELGECQPEDVDERLTWLNARAATADETADDDVEALDTLGDGTRYRLARLLVGADRELCVCELSTVVDVSESALSHALSDLRKAGLATRRKKGTWRYYASTDRTRAIFDALDVTREAAA